MMAVTVGAAVAEDNFVFIQGGTFIMGSPEDEPRRSFSETQRQVMVNSFYLGKCEVTQKEWRQVMGNNPSRFKGDGLPVEMVKWYDAIEYCNALSMKEGLSPAYRIEKDAVDLANSSQTDTEKWTITWDRNANGYRLPTEAEWEYACRAGTITPFSTGDIITTDQANYDGEFPYTNNTEGIYRGQTTAVGSFAPNQWGLYDMHGNVMEWCWDWWDGSYSGEAVTDPTGASSGSSRAVRSGDWYNRVQSIRSAHRSAYSPSQRNSQLGFRVARNGSAQ
jgi:formylglycine-generating enzyme required for sulfatase activity